MHASPFEVFRRRVEREIDQHPIVRFNAYTSWFAAGDVSLDELRYFTTQFSVFSHLFVEAQLRKCINAKDLASYRNGREILLNELGVTFTAAGSVDGGRCTFRAGHFEWLATFAAELGLEFDKIGKRSLGTPSTLAFCDALMNWYGSPDLSCAAGASYAIEHWAAAGFWKELIAGLRVVKARDLPELPLGFWTWHDALEATHAAHTDDELDAAFGNADFSQERFIEGGVAVLDAVHIFWDGLLTSRLVLK